MGSDNYYKDLELYTNGFSEENFIGKFQFGSVYHGKIPQGCSGMEAQEVTVKIYERSKIYKDSLPEDNSWKLTEEHNILRGFTHPHPALVKVIGFCNNGELIGLVYDLKPLDTVHNLILKDSFSWLHRIKVALEFSCLLEYFHFPRDLYRPCLVRNVDAAHIMVDKDYNAKLFDLSVTCGGLFPDTRDIVEEIIGCQGYMDPFFSTVGAKWSDKNDVFAFGVLLLGLISKKVLDGEQYGKNLVATPVHKWAQREYRLNKSTMCFGHSKPSLVHQSLEAAPEFYSSDGPKITKLAMRCVNYCSLKRPTMNQVVDCLLDLCVVRHHADSLGIEKLVRGRNPDSDPHEGKLSKVIRRGKLSEVIRRLIRKI